MLSFLNRRAARGDSREDRVPLNGPYSHARGNLWLKDLDVPGGDSNEGPLQSQLCLYEDGMRLTTGHESHDSIDRFGGGRYSHWDRQLYFSTTDNSDPNSNGRQYAFDLSLTDEDWRAARTARSAQRWLLHPEGADVLMRGGDRAPPPLMTNLVLTNSCNLRCEICGSQKHIDNTGVRRRHMSFAKFEAVAETIFPFLFQVELNSQGDPLLHPRIEDVLAAINRHRCEFKIQHNGTLLRDSIIDTLLPHFGSLMLSLDAVGPKFNEVRARGDWSKAEPGLLRLLKERDPKRMSVGVYPTWTARTIGEAIRIVEWCAEHGVDLAAFHGYWPVQGSSEVAPSQDEYRRACDELREWCVAHGDPLRVIFEGEVLNAERVQVPKSEFIDLDKQYACMDFPYNVFPMARTNEGADPIMTCVAPNTYVEIGLDGQISTCCRSQDIALGYATSLAEFADVWLGRNYEIIRESLRRGATGPYPLPNCESCIKFYLPGETGERRAVDYSKAAENGEPRLLVADGGEIRFESIQKEIGFCHIVTFPLGIGSGYALYENDTPLGPADCPHDDIRRLGEGRYHIGGHSVHFSTSDGTDARRNQRVYALKRPAVSPI